MRVCVFCGSSPGSRPIYLEGARAVGRALAERGVGVVYGDAALEAGGEVIGVIPHSMVDRELAHPGLTDLHVVEGMHERKALMTALSDAFLALPGGHGTLDELFEALTWAQLGIHAQPIGVWNLEGYWDPLFAMLDRVVEEGFLRPHHRTLLLSSHALEPLIDSLVS